MIWLTSKKKFTRQEGEAHSDFTCKDQQFKWCTGDDMTWRKGTKNGLLKAIAGRSGSLYFFAFCELNETGGFLWYIEFK